MKDIDFDELDRAVSSLMGAAPSDDAKTPAPAQEAVPEEETVTLSDSNEPQPDDTTNESTPVLNLDSPVVSSETELLKTQEPESSFGVTVRRETTLAPAPRRGRFMDVMRPAVRGTNKATPSSAVSRQGAALQPLGEPTQTEETMSTPDGMFGQPEVPVDQPYADTPLQNDTTFGEDTATTEAPVDMASAFDDALSGIVDDTPPQSSPFLPDAKVEKRPLGRPADTTPMTDMTAELTENRIESTVELPEATEDSISPDTDAQLPEQPLPAEFGSELLSIETSTEHLPPEVQPAVTPEVTVEAGQSPVPSPEPASSRPRTLETTSIPQQYKVQPQQGGEVPVGAIYDTQPLVHPPEKKPGWILIVSILAIILLGVGAGAAMYYLNFL